MLLLISWRLIVTDGFDLAAGRSDAAIDYGRGRDVNGGLANECEQAGGRVADECLLRVTI